MAQLGARLNGIEEVGGSNPPGSTVKGKPLSVLAERFVFICFEQRWDYSYVQAILARLNLLLTFSLLRSQF